MLIKSARYIPYLNLPLTYLLEIYLKLLYYYEESILFNAFCFNSVPFRPNGELENPTEMPDLPKMLDLVSFRNAILEKFNDRLGIEHVIDQRYLNW